MHTFIFGVAWTVIAAALAVALRLQPEWAQQTQFYRVIVTIMPFAGLLVVRDGMRRVRRYRSVRAEHLPSGPIFVWTDFDGTERRDETDPRPQWDAEDRNFAD